MCPTKYLISIFILLIGALPASAKAWRGIEPLHATRADVERLLGPPNFDKSAYSWGYDFPEERAFVSFYSGGCEEGLPGGWKVPNDTVMEIYLVPAVAKKWADVLIAGKEYEQTRAVHTPTVFYIDPDEGIRFTVADGYVQSIVYGPAARDEHLKCGEFQYAVPVQPGAKLNRIEQYPFDSFGNVHYEDAKARLDNFVIQLFQLKAEEPRWRGYIIVYAGRRAYIGEAQYKANCFKNYLVRVRHMDAGSLFAADGGFREEMQVQLYVGRSDYYPPVLLPEVSPKKVKVIRRRLRSCAEP